MTRNRLLALAAEVGAVSAVLEVAARIVGLSDRWSPEAAWYKAADCLTLVAPFISLLAFFVARAAFRRVARPSRLRALAIAVGLFAAGAAFDMAADLIRTVESVTLHAPWKFTATEVAWTIGRLALIAAAVLAATGFLASARDALLSRASLAFAAYAAFFAVGYGFDLAGVLGFPFSPSGATVGGLGVIAGSFVVEALGAVFVAAAFFDAGVRRARGDVWKARREGKLAVASIVFAVGFVVSAAGFMAYASPGHGTELWLLSFSGLGLAAAAGCAAVAFLGSRSRLEKGDGSDLAVLPDPV